MSAVPTHKLTPAEYLAIEQAAEFKSEFFNGEMFAMAGASRPHNTVVMNLGGEIHARLKGGPCRPYTQDQRVLIDRTGLYTYPDLLIVCGEVVTAADDADTITNPRVVVEVLSPSTERYDRTTKFRHYQQLPSVQEYILVSQSEPLCERFTRQADGSWALVSFVGLNAVLALTSVPVQVPLADIYAGVEFPDPPPR
ncbi:MAG: Uma2 family endonuclease [Gemmataceae bacterium]